MAYLSCINFNLVALQISFINTEENNEFIISYYHHHLGK